MNKAIFNTRKISTQFMVLKMSQKDQKKRPKTDAKKTGPPEDRKGQDRDRPKTENCRTETSLYRPHYFEIFSPYLQNTVGPCTVRKIVMFRSYNFRSSGGLGPDPFGPRAGRSFLHRSSGFFSVFFMTFKNHICSLLSNFIAFLCDNFFQILKKKFKIFFESKNR